jgi:penicillin-binding protein 1C
VSTPPDTDPGHGWIRRGSRSLLRGTASAGSPAAAPRRAAGILRLAALAIAATLGGAAAFVLWPLPAGLLDLAPTLVIADREGGTLREVRDAGAERLTPLPPGPLPRQVVDAFVAAEDRRFWSHPGIDALAIGRTLVTSLRAHRVTGGASTITQQLARALVPRPRTLGGKAREALWALRLHVHLSREEILRAYLDRVALGNGNAGVEAAAGAYFRRPAAQLSVAQSALLAGIAASPSRFDPVRHPESARTRMEWVLARMAATGSIGPAEARVAAADPLDRARAPVPFRAPHFVQAALSSVGCAGRGESRTGGPGLARAARVETTIDPELQTFVETVVREELAGLGDRAVGEAAVLVVDNASGEILAYAGSADVFDREHLGQNDGVRARRQPGSALKPFAYGLALASGMTPADLIPDVEARFATPAGDFQPRNYDRRLHGPVRLRAALANSYNVPAVRVCDRIGPERVLRVLHGAGFDGLDADASRYGVGLVLGDGEVSLYELARAYAGLANGGVLRPLVMIRHAWDARGGDLPLPRPAPPRRFLPADAVMLVTDILADDAARAPAFGLDNALRFPYAVAAKTGTSRAHVDNWTAGYTRERTVAVWAGNFDGRPMRGVSGITGAGPLFHRVMARAMRGIRPAPLVDRSRFDDAVICPLSGQLAGPACPARAHEIFLPGSAPRAACAMHRWSPGAGGRARVLDVGPTYRAWARGEGIDDGPSRGSGAARSRLLVPADGDEYLVDPGLPLADQTIPVRIEPGGGVTTLEIALDGVPARRLAAPFVGRVPATRGAHRLEVFEPGGEAPVATAAFTVR